MAVYKNLKKKAHSFIIKKDKSKWYQKIFPYFVYILIVLNVIAVILESVESIRELNKNLFRLFEIFSVIVFTIEYIVRVWVAEHEFINRTAFKARIKFIFSFFGMIDLFAILPFYLPMLIKFDLRFLRILRLMRLFRLFKIARYSKALKMVGTVLRNKKESLLLTLVVTLMLLLVASSLMYHIEHDSQPSAFPNILASFWWAVATLTTIGYGDIYPITGWGKFLSGIIALLGIGLVALPTGIIGSGFIEVIEKKKERSKFCPNCGKKYRVDTL
ncbi:MAG: ion transporter [Candidatus Aminicenantes bacterium]|nr:ion transporter [Candidatus Aminicenantes bacterium]